MLLLTSSSYNTAAADSTATALLGISMVGVVLLIYAAIFIFAIAIGIVLCIPYYKMARNQGMNNAWLAFIPIGNTWILSQLSQREYNIFNWIRFKERKKAFYFWLIFTGCQLVIVLGMTFLMSIPYIGLLFGVLYYPVAIVLGIAAQIIGWRFNYDLLCTYGEKEHAMAISIISCFIPIVMIVYSFIIMNREPDFEA